MRIQCVDPSILNTENKSLEIVSSKQNKTEQFKRHENQIGHIVVLFLTPGI